MWCKHEWYCGKISQSTLDVEMYRPKLQWLEADLSTCKMHILDLETNGSFKSFGRNCFLKQNIVNWIGVCSNKQEVEKEMKSKGKKNSKQKDDTKKKVW